MSLTDTMRPQEDDFDIIVVGSGAAGLLTAILCHLKGLKVLLLEKTDKIGGATAISGGAIWAPNHHHMGETGYVDSLEKAQQYLKNLTGNDGSPMMQKAFLEEVPNMLSFATTHNIFKVVYRGKAPDYYPDMPGANLGGRPVDPAIFDGRKLGEKFKELRDPLREFTVFGKMMVNVADVNNLLRAHKSFSAFYASLKILSRYFLDRLRGYHRGTRLLLGNSLAAQLFNKLLELKIEYRLNAEVTTLVNEKEKVTGVTLSNGDSITAKRGVVLACGGFPYDEELRDKIFPKPTQPFSLAPQSNTGDGIRLAQAIGAQLGSKDLNPAFWAPVSIYDYKDEKILYPHLVWDRAKPGLIAVNSKGKRFVNEATSYHEFCLALYRNGNDIFESPSFLICDNTFLKRWGLGLVQPGARKKKKMLKAGYLLEGKTIVDLAKKMNIDSETLTATIDFYNDDIKEGIDSQFGKGSNEYNRNLGDVSHTPNPCLAPLITPPFYAVKVYPGDIGTSTGIITNEKTEVLDESNQIVENLYVVGNDMHSVFVGQYAGSGITLGPALTFAWICANHLATKD